jgi:hypothetical protein
LSVSEEELNLVPHSMINLKFEGLRLNYNRSSFR